MNWANRSRRTLLLVLIYAVMLAAGSSALADGKLYSSLDGGELFKKGTLYTESIDMMFDVTAGGALSLGTTNGSVTIKTWSRSQVRLVITKTTSAESPYNARTILEDFLVQARHGGRDLDLKGVANSESCKKTVGVTFEVWVPQDYNVDINTGKGDVDIGKISGSFSAKTGDGKISFECDPDGMDIEVEDNSKGKTPSADDDAVEVEPDKPADSKGGNKLGAGESAKSKGEKI
jgi:hypothetical protein